MNNSSLELKTPKTYNTACMQNYFRKTSGSTLMEVIAVLGIVSLGVISAYSIIGSWRKLSAHTENTIKAINIARDGMEGLIVIRNTNWVKFSSDRTNCWNTLNSNVNCIGNPFPSAAQIGTGSYIIYNEAGIWTLSGIVADTLAPEDSKTNWTGYRSKYKVFIDGEGYASQTGTYATECKWATSTGCISRFARELYINYTGTGIMNISSIVKWYDQAFTGSAVYKQVILNTELTNWKSKF